MNTKIKKSELNLSIDLLMFIIMITIAGVGFLIRYVLIPGFKRNDIYGRNVELYYLGLDRHQWGTIHLILGFVLLFLLLLHIIFHWKQIIGLFKIMVSSRALRFILSMLIVLFTIIFGILPLYITPEVRQGVSHHTNNNQTDNGSQNRLRQHDNQVAAQPIVEQPQKVIPTAGKQENRKQANHSDVEIFGYMTINEVAEKYNVSAQDLAKSINIPVGNNDKKLGRLKKQYNFQLSEIRNYIVKND